MKDVYQKRNFQRVFLNDIYHIEKKLQSCDHHLHLMWNLQNGEHVIVDGLLETSIMNILQIAFEVLDTRIVDHSKKIHTANGFSTVDTKKKRQRKQKLDDLAEDYAKESKKFGMDTLYKHPDECLFLLVSFLLCFSFY